MQQEVIAKRWHMRQGLYHGVDIVRLVRAAETDKPGLVRAAEQIPGQRRSIV